MTDKPDPRPDQIADLAFFINNPKAGLLHDPGVGKTVTAALYTEYCLDYQGWKSIWLQPLSLMKKNKDEIARFTGIALEDIVIVEGSKEKKLELIRGPGKVFLMVPATYTKYWLELLTFHPDIKLNVCDEIQLYYANHKSKRTQEWYRACQYMKSVIPMSGTLIKGKLSSAYPSIQVMNPLLYGTYESFMAQHALYDDYGRQYGWKNHEKLRNVLGATSIRRSFESVYGDSHPVVQVEMCQMADKVRAAYDEFSSLGTLELEDSFLQTENPGTVAIRCRQIMAHPHTFGLVKEGELTGKDERMMIHVEEHVETDERLVIFAALIPEQERIYNMLKNAGLKVGLINGTVPYAERIRIDQEFRNGTLQFIVGSAATAGVGFNWPFLRMIIFASLDYGDDTFTQAYKRAIRGVRDKPLLVIVLEYEQSIDQRIFRIIEQKAKDYAQVDETKPEIFLRAAKEAKAKTKTPIQPGGFSMDNV